MQPSFWRAPADAADGSGMPLRLRLSLMITALLAVVTFAGGIYVVRKACDDTQAEIRSTLTLAAHLLDGQIAVLRDHWTPGATTASLFHLRELGDIRHLSLKFYDREGRLLDSNEAPDEHAAVAPHWFELLVGIGSPVLQSEVRTLSFDGAEVGRLVIAPDPSYETEEMWTTSRGLLALLLVFFALVIALVWWAVSRAMQPVEQILQALDELRRGNLAARLPPFRVPELSCIGVGFNHMAQTLERSVAENRNLTRRLLDTQERERAHIARELHDEIGQCMSAIHADAVAIRNRGGTAVSESAQAIVEVTGHIKEIVRSMLQRLRPPALAGLGLTSALRDLLASFQQRNPQVACALRSGGDLALVEDEVAVAVYRVVQECLTNVARHADARHAVIEVLQLTEAPSADTGAARALASPRRVRVTVSDDGVGFAPAAARGGLGLLGIRERVGALGGAASVDSRPGRGTRICIEVPLPGELEQAR